MAQRSTPYNDPVCTHPLTPVYLNNETNYTENISYMRCVHYVNASSRDVLLNYSLRVVLSNFDIAKN